VGTQSPELGVDFPDAGIGYGHAEQHRKRGGEVNLRDCDADGS
jgi:hypothetical protein